MTLFRSLNPFTWFPGPSWSGCYLHLQPPLSLLFPSNTIFHQHWIMLFFKLCQYLISESLQHCALCLKHLPPHHSHISTYLANGHSSVGLGVNITSLSAYVAASLPYLSGGFTPQALNSTKAKPVLGYLPTTYSTVAGSPQTLGTK